MSAITCPSGSVYKIHARWLAPRCGPQQQQLVRSDRIDDFLQGQVAHAWHRFLNDFTLLLR